MDKRTKALLIILGVVLVIAIGVFIWWKQSEKSKSQAALVWPPIGGGTGITGYFGDLTVIVKDKDSGAPLPGATVAFNGKISNSALEKAGVKCTNHSLMTGSDGKALFTKANNSKDLKTWAKGSVSGISQEGICEYTVTTTKAPIYKPNVQNMSWPEKPANRANLGTKEILLEKPGTGTLKGTIKWKKFDGTTACLMGATKPGTTDTTQIAPPPTFNMSYFDKTSATWKTVSPRLQINCGYTLSLPVLAAGESYMMKTGMISPVPIPGITPPRFPPLSQIKEGIVIVKDQVTSVDWLLEKQ